MIELVVQGIHTPVRQQPLAFRFKNPILHKADGSVVYNVEVPITPVSREVFKYVERLESKTFGKPEKLVGELYVKGAHIGNVGVQVDGVSGGHYRVSAGLNRGLFNFTVKDARLRDFLKPVEFTLPESTEDILDLILASVTDQADTLPFNMFPVRNLDAFKDEAGWAAIIPFKEYLGYQNSFVLPPPLAAKSQLANTPFFKVSYVIRKIAELSGYHLTDNELEKIPELNRLVIYSNNYQFVTGDYWPYSASVWKLGDFMPDCSVFEFLDSIETIFNAKLIPDSKKMEAKFVFTDEPFDTTQIIDLKVPQSAIVDVDFLKRQQNYAFEYGSPNDELWSESVRDYREGEYTFKGIVANESALPAASTAKWGDAYLSAATRRNYVLTLNPSGDPIWSFFGYNYIKEIVGGTESALTFNTLVTPVLPGFYLHDSPDSTLLIECPVLSTEGYGSFYNGPYKDPGGIRLMFYRGLALTSPVPYSYPYASSDNLKPDGTPIAGAEYAIRWDGPGGFLEKFWPKRLNWMRSSNLPIMVSKMLSIQELSDWNWTSGYLVGSRKCLSSIIEGEIMPDGVVKTRIELYPL